MLGRRWRPLPLQWRCCWSRKGIVLFGHQGPATSHKSHGAQAHNDIMACNVIKAGNGHISGSGLEDAGNVDVLLIRC